MILRPFLVLSLLIGLLAGCDVPDFNPELAVTPEAASEQIYVATNRARNEAGWYSSARGARLDFLSVPVNFPTNYTPGDAALIREHPKPDRDFSVGARRDYDAAGFAAALKGRKEITIYVHGYYNAFFNGVFQSAQLRRDFDLPGAMVYFSWPSKGSSAGYAYDRESLLYSRDALERLLRLVAGTGAARVNLIGHSLGAMLIMETLRQIEIADPGWVHRNIDGMAFVSPDIDIQVFASQAERLQSLPKATVVFVSDQDKVLLLSSKISGTTKRLGNTTNLPVTTQGEITVVDVSSLAGDARSGHFIPAASPTAIQLISNGPAFVDFFPRDGLGRRVGNNLRLFELTE